MQYVYAKAFVNERNRQLRSVVGVPGVDRHELPSRGSESIPRRRPMRFAVRWIG